MKCPNLPWGCEPTGDLCPACRQEWENGLDSRDVEWAGLPPTPGMTPEEMYDAGLMRPILRVVK